MKIPAAAQRAAQRMRENATPLYDYIMDKMGGNALNPLGAALGSLTPDVIRLLQKPGIRGYLGITFYEPPQPDAQKNKFTLAAALNYTGTYPRHLLNAKGLEVFYNEKSSKK